MRTTFLEYLNVLQMTSFDMIRRTWFILCLYGIWKVPWYVVIKGRL